MKSYTFKHINATTTIVTAKNDYGNNQTVGRIKDGKFIHTPFHNIGMPIIAEVDFPVIEQQYAALNLDLTTPIVVAKIDNSLNELSEKWPTGG